MNFDLTETQELFKATAQRFAATIDITERTKLRSLIGRYDRKRWKQLAELGLLSIAVEEARGGLGGTLTDVCVIAETLGQNNCVDPWLELGMLPLSILGKSGTGEYIEDLIDGSKIASLAFAEPDQRYQLRPTNTSARLTPDSQSYLINGVKTFVMGASQADLLLVTACIEDQFSVFCVPSDSAGIEKQHYLIADGSQAAEIKFNQVKVPASSLLALDYEGFKHAISEVCTMASAEILGLANLLFQETLTYVKEREQFGVKIGSFQAIQHGLVDCYSDLEQMRSLLYQTLIMEEPLADKWHANIMGTKAFIAERAIRIAQASVQYHGAMGITDELAVGHSMKRIMLLSRLFGDNSYNLREYGSAL